MFFSAHTRKAIIFTRSKGEQAELRWSKRRNGNGRAIYVWLSCVASGWETRMGGWDGQSSPWTHHIFPHILRGISYISAESLDSPTKRKKS